MCRIEMLVGTELAGGRGPITIPRLQPTATVHAIYLPLRLSSPTFQKVLVWNDGAGSALRGAQQKGRFLSLIPTPCRQQRDIDFFLPSIFSFFLAAAK